MKSEAIAECSVCGKHFVRLNSLQSVCGIRCSAKVATLKRKAERANDKARWEKLKTRSDWIKDAQQAVNAYVRMRDAHLPCISCGRMHDGQWHAGHYLSTGARPELRFEQDNIHKQCQPCNTHLSGNLLNYRVRLISKIGLNRVEWLEGPHEPSKPTIEDLKAIRDEYRAKSRELAKMHE